MGAGIFKPECTSPIWLLPNKMIATACGHYTGIGFGFIVSIFLLAFAYKRHEDFKKQNPDKYDVWWIASWFMCIGVMLLFALLFAYLNGQSWKGYQHQIDFCMKTTDPTNANPVQTRQKCLDNIQSMEQARMTAKAIRKSGSPSGGGVSTGIAMGVAQALTDRFLKPK